MSFNRRQSSQQEQNQRPIEVPSAGPMRAELSSGSVRRNARSNKPQSYTPSATPVPGPPAPLAKGEDTGGIERMAARASKPTKKARLWGSRQQNDDGSVTRLPAFLPQTDEARKPAGRISNLQGIRQLSWAGTSA